MYRSYTPAILAGLAFSYASLSLLMPVLYWHTLCKQSPPTTFQDWVDAYKRMNMPMPTR